MRSIPAAMCWELFVRARRTLLVATLFAISFPALIFAVLRLDGAFNPADPDILRVYVFLIQANFAAVCVLLFSIPGRTSRMYAFPARTSTLVAWRLVPAMAGVALETTAVIVALNAMFNLECPVWGPVLAVVAGTACFRAVCWATEKSLWAFPALTVAAAIGLEWFSARFGFGFSGHGHKWDHVTLGEGLTLAAATAAAYALAVYGVARNRRGEPPLSLGVLTKVLRLFDRAPTAGAPFRSPLDAQAWLEWQRKGNLMPTGVVSGIAIAFVLWMIVSHNLREFADVAIMSAAAMSMVGFIGGLAFGSIGPNNTTTDMGHFMATRPLTSADMARSILKTAARSLLVAWSIWAGAMVVFVAVLAVLGQTDVLKLPDMGWWYFPLTLVASWTMVGGWTALMLAGHSKRMGQALFAIVSLFTIAPAIQKWILTPWAATIFQLGICTTLGVALTAGTAWAYVAARRRDLVGRGATAAAWIAWAAGCAIAAPQIPMAPVAAASPFGPAVVCVLLAGLMALAIVPLAGAPLALAWNRNR